MPQDCSQYATRSSVLPCARSPSEMPLNSCFRGGFMCFREDCCFSKDFISCISFYFIFVTRRMVAIFAFENVTSLRNCVLSIFLQL